LLNYVFFRRCLALLQLVAQLVCSFEITLVFSLNITDQIFHLGYFLWGRLLRLRDASPAAIDAFRRSLQLDSSMWVAYEQLCELGVFDLSPEIAFADNGTAAAAAAEAQDNAEPTKLAKSSLFDSGASNSSGAASIASASMVDNTPRTGGGFRGVFTGSDSATPSVNPAMTLDFSATAAVTPIGGALAFETPTPVAQFAASNEPPPMTAKTRNNSQRGSSAGDSVATTAVRRTLITSACRRLGRACQRSA
jgi:hypothetical protein